MRKTQGILINKQARAKEETQGNFVNQAHRSKRDSQGILVNLPPREERDAKEIWLNYHLELETTGFFVHFKRFYGSSFVL